MADLFPGVVLPEPDYTYLHRAIREVCAGAGLRANTYFMDKVQQVYETMRVRHGFMLIGNPIGGKTVALRTLSKALAIMNERVRWWGWGRLRVVERLKFMNISNGS